MENPKRNIKKILLLLLIFSGIIIGILSALVIGNIQYETSRYMDYTCVPHLLWDKDPTYLRQYAKFEENEKTYTLEYQKIHGISPKKVVGAKCKVGTLFPYYDRQMVLVNADDGFSPWDDWSIDRIFIKLGDRSRSSDDDTIKKDLIGIIERYYSDKTIGDSIEHIDGVTAVYDIKITFDEVQSLSWMSEIVINDDSYSDIVYLRLDRYESFTNVKSQYVIIPQDSPLYRFVLDAIRQ